MRANSCLRVVIVNFALVAAVSPARRVFADPAADGRTQWQAHEFHRPMHQLLAGPHIKDVDRALLGRRTRLAGAVADHALEGHADLLRELNAATRFRLTRFVHGLVYVDFGRSGERLRHSVLPAWGIPKAEATKLLESLNVSRYRLLRHLQQALRPQERAEVLALDDLLFSSLSNYPFQQAALMADRTTGFLVDGVFGFDYERIQQGTHCVQADGEFAEHSKIPAGSSYTLLDRARPALNLQPGDTVIDIGSSVGRVLLWLARLHPKVRFIGYEINDVMVGECRQAVDRFALTNVEVYPADMTHASFAFEPATHFVAFDPLLRKSRRSVFDRVGDALKDGEAKLLAIDAEDRFLPFVRELPLVKAHRPVAEIPDTLWRAELFDLAR